jgi:hypothetical protein
VINGPHSELHYQDTYHLMVALPFIVPTIIIKLETASKLDKSTAVTTKRQ